VAGSVESCFQVQFADTYDHCSRGSLEKQSGVEAGGLAPGESAEQKVQHRSGISGLSAGDGIRNHVPPLRYAPLRFPSESLRSTVQITTPAPRDPTTKNASPNDGSNLGARTKLADDDLRSNESS